MKNKKINVVILTTILVLSCSRLSYAGNSSSWYKKFSKYLPSFLKWKNKKKNKRKNSKFKRRTKQKGIKTNKEKKTLFARIWAWLKALIGKYDDGNDEFEKFRKRKKNDREYNTLEKKLENVIKKIKEKNISQKEKIKRLNCLSSKIAALPQTKKIKTSKQVKKRLKKNVKKLIRSIDEGYDPEKIFSNAKKDKNDHAAKYHNFEIKMKRKIRELEKEQMPIDKKIETLHSMTNKIKRIKKKPTCKCKEGSRAKHNATKQIKRDINELLTKLKTRSVLGSSASRVRDFKRGLRKKRI